MLDVALEKDLIELLAANFKTTQIEEVGRLLFGEFDLYRLTREHRHMTIPPRRAAEQLLEVCRKRHCFGRLIQLIVETDGTQFMGRHASLEGIELFLENLTKAGLVYDFDKRRVAPSVSSPKDLANWGSLRDGRAYYVTVISIDVVGNSRLVRRHGMRKIRKLYFKFRQFMNEKLQKYNGRVWNWNGDGGIVAFTFKNHEVRAVQFAFELQRTIPLFNSFCEHGVDADLELRIALDAGRVRFAGDTGSIVSEVINFVSHLEKQATPAGHIAVSEAVYSALPPRLSAAFTRQMQFEGQQIRLVPARLDVLVDPRGIL